MSKPRPQALTSDQFVEIGRTLFGDQWQSDTARALKISRQSVIKMVKGEHTVHAGFADELGMLCNNRGIVLREWEERLKDIVDEAVDRGEYP